MRMVAPRTGAPEISVAENQPEYKTVTASVYSTDQGIAVLMRFRLEEGDLEALKRGEDIYLSVLTCGKPLQPFGLYVGQPDWTKVEGVPDGA